MFKNKYFIRNPQMNRIWIQNINNLVKSSQRLAELQKQLEDLKEMNKECIQQTKTIDTSDSSSATKSIKQKCFWNHQLPFEVIKYYAFLRESIGGQIFSSTLVDTTKIPQINLQFLSKEQKLVYIKTALLAIRKAFEQQENFLQSIKQQRFSNRLKIYFIYERVSQFLKKALVQNGKIYKTCHQLLLELFRQELIHHTNAKINNKVKSNAVLKDSRKIINRSQPQIWVQPLQEVD